jgi:CheY-like chemotaxis protein
MQLSTSEESDLIAGLRIIVVDDIRDCRDLVAMYLEQKKAQVKAVSCPKKALNILENFDAELIISDIYMPEEDGYWFIEQLNKINQKLPRYVPAIALTVAVKDREQKRIITAGYDGYLAKPFMLEDLTLLITQLIRKLN